MRSGAINHINMGGNVSQDILDCGSH